MKKLLAVILTFCLYTHSYAQHDSTPFYRHTFGVDLIWIVTSFTTPVFYKGGSDVNIDFLYRYQLNRKWGIQSGASYRKTSMPSPVKTIDKAQSEGYAIRVGPIYSLLKNKPKEVHFTAGVNVLASFLTEHNSLTIPNGLWGDFHDSYTLTKNRYAMELETGVEGSLSERFGVRLLGRIGYSPTPTDKYGLKGANYAGIYNWLNSSDAYFYLSVFFFVRAGKTHN